MEPKQTTGKKDGKGFFKRLIEKLDAKMQQKAKAAAPCCGSEPKDKDRGGSCCS